MRTRCRSALGAPALSPRRNISENFVAYAGNEGEGRCRRSSRIPGSLTMTHSPEFEARSTRPSSCSPVASVAVLTGAGISTDSGIPDYRGEGAPVRTPMTVPGRSSTTSVRASATGPAATSGGATSRPPTRTPAIGRWPTSSSPASSTASSRRTSTGCTCGPDRGASSTSTARWIASAACTAARSSRVRTSPTRMAGAEPVARRPRRACSSTPTATSTSMRWTTWSIPDVLRLRRHPQARGRVLRGVRAHREVRRGAAPRPHGRRAGHRRLVARGQLRHPAARPGGRNAGCPS